MLMLKEKEFKWWEIFRMIEMGKLKVGDEFTINGKIPILAYVGVGGVVKKLSSDTCISSYNFNKSASCTLNINSLRTDYNFRVYNMDGFLLVSYNLTQLTKIQADKERDDLAVKYFNGFCVDKPSLVNQNVIYEKILEQQDID